MVEHVPPYVVKADDDSVSVKATDDDTIGYLFRSGFSRNANQRDWFTLRIKDDQEKAHVFSKLRDRGIAFSDGREWCPMEVFEYLRDKKHLHGGFRVIAWKGPNQWFIREHE